MYIDTHAHLDFADYDADREEIIRRAKQSCVEYIINIGTDVESTKKSIALAHKYDFIYASLGVHPHDAGTVSDDVILQLKELARDKKIVAVGEVGLDFHKEYSPKEAQKNAFIKFIRLAGELGLPLIIHDREAHRDTLDILKKELKGPLRGVLHCFSGSAEFARECVDLGFYISFTCNLTYKNAAKLRETAKAIPIERILLETDCPFLAPQKFRGERNEPAHISHLAEELAKLKELAPEDIARITTLNAKTLFKIGEVSKGGVIAYRIRESLYLNITNRCTDNCSFCIRNFTNFVKGHNLKLSKEPSVPEILDLIDDPKQYKEIVFCGLGEPFLRLDVIKELSKALKNRGARYIRIDTNGHGNLIHKRNIVPELKGIVDEICVSFHVDNKKRYNELCRPQFGEETFEKVKEFAIECKSYIPKVTVTLVDMPGAIVENFVNLSKELGVDYRIRKLGIVG
ncbi:MAG: TatD family hydrolase [Candidatus Omnitrophota bacterium]